MIYDTAVIGTGPAGISAVLNLKIHEKNFIWIGSRNLSDKITKAERISNYPGLINLSGKEMNEIFRKQLDSMEIGITEQMVNSIMPFGDHYALMAGSDFYEARTVILTTGIANVGTLPGESEYVGKGVSYCATCDGNLYRGKTVAIVCNAARFEQEVAFLADLAAKVYYFPLYKEVSLSAANLTIMDRKAVGILGDKRVNGVKLSGGDILPVDGIFCLRDSVALSTLLPKLKTENGHISVDRSMATNLPGVFAAGDCTGRPYQYAKSVGEGNVAAHSVIEYLSRTETSSK
ncbi:MAG: NAD(P)/FAD-dependent oxidoreductase [Eubacteriales bacterium]